MAIVFDSDAGTITGLSVGGLPDGVVDADTLAANAVTEHKIASSAVVTAKLNDDAVTNAKMANDAITEHELAGSAVVTAAINDDAITAAKMASGVGGKILQVKNQVQATEVTSNSATYTDTGCSLSITPSSTSSKILIISSNDCTKYGADTAVAIRCYRDSTEIGGTIIGRRICDSDNSDKEQAIFSFTVLDSPNTTSAITYKTQYNNTYAGGTVRINAGSGSSTFCLMEVGV